MGARLKKLITKSRNWLGCHFKNWFWFRKQANYIEFYRKTKYMINKNKIKRDELGRRSSQKVPKFSFLWRCVMLLGKIQFSQFHRIKSRQLVITWIKSSFVNFHITFLFALRYILSCYGTLILQLLVTKQR